MKSFIFLILVAFISGCGTPSPSTNAAVSNVQGCTLKFDADVTADLCSWYSNNVDRECDGEMINVLNKRRVKTSPKSECGQPINQPVAQVAPSCDSYTNASSPFICDAYWNNRDRACDLKMFNVIKNRNQILSQNRCGQPLSGTSVSSVNTTPSPLTVQASCSVEYLQSFVAQSPSALCAIAHGGGSCSKIAKLSLQGKVTIVGDSLASCGQPEKSDCATMLDKFAASTNSTDLACFARNDKSSVTAFKCRSNISGYLLNFQKSSGLGGNKCAQPLTSVELNLLK